MTLLPKRLALELHGVLAPAGRLDLLDELKALPGLRARIVRVQAPAVARARLRRATLPAPPVDPPAAPELLTSAAAARRLGVSSPNTVKSWLQGGRFPGAFRTAGGRWRFPRAEVEAVRRELEALRDRAHAGALDPSVADEADDPPLLEGPRGRRAR